jgi:hypothetical protein
VKKSEIKKHKTKIIAALVILAALAGSWFLGGAPEVTMPGEPMTVAAAAAEPVESTKVIIAGQSSDSADFIVTLSVRADMILYNMSLLHRDKHELVPPDGIIFPPTEVTAYEGESVFDVLQREMRNHRIHMASRFTPMFNSAYVEAINNLYEFDVGPLSGWMYSVNGWFPNFGSSLYFKPRRCNRMALHHRFRPRLECLLDG